ncbi:MAG: PTS sugar transporter subunit IIA [Kiritimatiellae bacterium]|nr:PTS sugar transporter subunit IIA [Kiritimatiellia bacterium]
MKSQINIMRQLQELVLTRDEHNQTGDGSHLDQLNDSIDALQAQLEPQLAAVYQRLYKKSHIVISAMTNNCCAVCGMQVPIAQGQQVRLGQHLVTCSSCGRILFADSEDAAHNVAEPVKDDEQKTGISRFSAEELMVVDLGAKDRVGAITALAEAMEKNGFVSNSDSLISAAMDRESVLSTAMEGGIAFPHVRGVEGGGLTLAMGVSREGIDWDGENTVNIVFLSAIPVAVSAFYLRLMSGLVQAFSKDANRNAILEAEDQAALWKALCKATRTTVK